MLTADSEDCNLFRDRFRDYMYCDTKYHDFVCITTNELQTKNCSANLSNNKEFEGVIPLSFRGERGSSEKVRTYFLC